MNLNYSSEAKLGFRIHNLCESLFIEETHEKKCALNRNCVFIPWTQPSSLNFVPTRSVLNSFLHVSWFCCFGRSHSSTWGKINIWLWARKLRQLGHSSSSRRRRCFVRLLLLKERARANHSGTPNVTKTRAWIGWMDGWLVGWLGGCAATIRHGTGIHKSGIVYNIIFE